MTDCSELEPINNQIIFEFLEDTTQKKFNSKTKEGIIVVDNAENQMEYCRWGKVLATGPKVSDDVNVGDIILIEKMMWTTQFVLEDQPRWITQEEHILCMWEDKDNLPGEVAV